MDYKQFGGNCDIKIPKMAARDQNLSTIADKIITSLVATLPPDWPIARSPRSSRLFIS